MKTTETASAATKRVPNAPGEMPANSGGTLVLLPVHLVVPATATACDVIATANAGQEPGVLAGMRVPRAVTGNRADRVPSVETSVQSAANVRIAATCARLVLSVHSAVSVATDSVRAVANALRSEAIAKAPLSGAMMAVAVRADERRDLIAKVFGPEHQTANGREKKEQVIPDTANAATPSQATPGQAVPGKNAVLIAESVPSANVQSVRLSGIVKLASQGRRALRPRSRVRFVKLQ